MKRRDKKIKNRNPIAKSLAEKTAQQKIIADKTKYNRKIKKEDSKDYS